MPIHRIYIAYGYDKAITGLFGVGFAFVMIFNSFGYLPAKGGQNSGMPK
jgi:hypothetical protein